MAFAFNPDDGPPRIIRYVARGTLPGVGLLALYDKSQNLLIIDREHFDSLTATEQHIILRTQKSFLEVTRHANGNTSLAA